MGIACLLLGWWGGCTPAKHAFPSEPSREAYPGFSWAVVQGDDLKMWAQSNDELRVAVVDSLREAYVYRLEGGTWKPISRVVKLFDLPSGDMDDLLPELDLSVGCACAFTRAMSGREGVERYTLAPTGSCLEEYKRQASREPIPTTCNGWGVGNSGYRYFERFTATPNQAIFVEIGQEAPLFDEHSLVLLAE